MHKKIVFMCLLLWLASFCLAGCSRREAKDPENAENVYTVYYVNQSGTKLVKQSYTAQGTLAEALVEELIEQMRVLEVDMDCRPAVPDNVTLTEYNIENNLLYLYFDPSYNSMDAATEVLCRSALVKTLAQIKDIYYVTIYVGDKPLADAKGNAIGVMQPENFIEDSGGDGSAYQTVTLNLYFTNETGDRLIETEKEVTENTTNTSIEKMVVKALLKGPDQEGLYPTLPSSATLLGVRVKDGVCYVNFNDAFVADALDVADYVPIYSIVNSLSEISGINKVQITVNGSSDYKFRDSIPLDTLFERNLDYVGGN
ncbi:GerMN domain-containing protein [Lachnotalea sp. AF33-28]|uniref:GerMN domain-containing protein n=1 Tax=Lachnotalea sp. AF33-28 TaxID=2292046 RepID=UPI000E5300D0|nr:GerMN domain-containing protein [Lachnotalea sp. AF33-28]RHP33186.1 hypothetical protein DWZ56_11010 [Lachnotalea sp. AF33-28]